MRVYNYPMQKLLAKLLLTALSLILISYLVPGITVASFYIAIVVALVFGILNILVRPVLILLTLPINILTLGLFTLVINAFLFWFVSTFIDGFTVVGAMAAFVGALVLSALHWLIEKAIN